MVQNGQKLIIQIILGVRRKITKAATKAASNHGSLLESFKFMFRPQKASNAKITKNVPSVWKRLAHRIVGCIVNIVVVNNSTQTAIRPGNHRHVLCAVLNMGVTQLLKIRLL